MDDSRRHDENALSDGAWVSVLWVHSARLDEALVTAVLYVDAGALKSTLSCRSLTSRLRNFKSTALEVRYPTFCGQNLCAITARHHLGCRSPQSNSGHRRRG